MSVTKKLDANTWQATTLAFSNLDTASDQPTNSLFSLSSLRPGGFQVRSLRLHKDGQMNFNYRVKPEITGGNPALCQNLTFTLLQNWQKRYEGALPQVDTTFAMTDPGKDDWIAVVSLANQDRSLANQSCSFDLIFQSTGKGFADESRLQNQISTGSW